jgi:hypothetical protein
MSKARDEKIKLTAGYLNALAGSHVMHWLARSVLDRLDP